MSSQPLRVLLVVLLPALAIACASAKPCSESERCDSDERCVFNERSICLPACSADGGCPEGFSCDSCMASGECPVCAVCVPACAPTWWR